MEEVEQEIAVKSYTYHSPDKRYSICGVLSPLGNKMSIGIALKNDMDSFSRKLGHKIALGRAMKRPLIEIEVEPQLNHAKAFYGYAAAYSKLFGMISEKNKSFSLTITPVTAGEIKKVIKKK